MTQWTNRRMAEVYQRVSQLGAMDCELLPGPFGESDMQLSIGMSNGVQLSVLPDSDVPAMFEVVRLDGPSPELTDKLSIDAVVDAVRLHLQSSRGATPV
jgi:hypothetical protein